MNPRLLAGLIAAAMVSIAFAHPYPFGKGVIEKIDASSKRITVNTTDGSRVFELTDRTPIYRGKEKLGFHHLKVGDAIKMRYHTNETGQAFIERLKIDASDSR